jgi:Tfp pilus assembly protein PilN
MKRIAPLEFVARTPRRPWAWLLLVAALPLLAWQGLRYGEALERRDEQAAALRKLDLAARVTRRPVSDADVRYVAQAGQAAAQLSAPWGSMLAMLEEHKSEDIALLRLEPNAKTGQLKLTGEARSGAAMVAFLESLERDVRLSQVTLVNHQLQRQTPGEPLRFTVNAVWLLGVAASAPAEPASAQAAPTTTAQAAGASS